MLHDVLGTELPIVQAPMAGSQGADLAVAVSNAGGLGSLPCAMLSPEGLRAELTSLSSRTTGPWNVNFFCHETPVHDPARESAWQSTLEPYYRELGVGLSEASRSAGRSAFNDRMADVLEEFRPAVVSFHFGLPSPELLGRVRGWGARVLSSATTLDEARWLQARGVDAIIAQGIEAGGHRGMFLTSDLNTQVGTLALVSQLVRHLRVPVIAAGGISDASGVAAAMALGAAGVQVGTAYLLCPEATTTAVHRAALASEDARHTAITNLFTGRPARGIVNRLMREIGPMSDAVPPFPLAAAAVMPLRAAAEREGSSDFSPLWAGQNAADSTPMPAAQLTRALAAGIGRYR